MNIVTDSEYVYDIGGNLTTIDHNAGAETISVERNSQYQINNVPTNGTVAEEYDYDAPLISHPVGLSDITGSIDGVTLEAEEEICVTCDCNCP